MGLLCPGIKVCTGTKLGQRVFSDNFCGVEVLNNGLKALQQKFMQLRFQYVFGLAELFNPAKLVVNKK